MLLSSQQLKLKLKARAALSTAWRARLLYESECYSSMTPESADGHPPHKREREREREREAVLRLSEYCVHEEQISPIVIDKQGGQRYRNIVYRCTLPDSRQSHRV